jgi:exodeoxyribonuclease III
MTRRRKLTIASVNVNGLRAAVRNGMTGWFGERRPDITTLQEVRAPDELLPDLVGELRAAAGARSKFDWAHHECVAKGRAGVAVIGRAPIDEHRAGLPGGDDRYDDSGRWIEADYATADDRGLTVVSAYVHTGDAESPDRMAEKLAFLDAMTVRLEVLRASGRHVLLTGDLNVAHREVDLKNWKGNLKSAGFLPEERAWFDRMFQELGWVDVVRERAGTGPGPYTWWSFRGRAFDNDVGWRIDYHIATPDLGAAARSVTIDRAPSYDTRWSDHAPVVVTYEI